MRVGDFFDALLAALALAKDLNPAFVGARLVDALVVVDSDAHDERVFAANIIEAALNTFDGSFVAVSRGWRESRRVWVDASSANVAVKNGAVEL